MQAGYNLSSQQDKERRMTNDYDLEIEDNFRINPQVWLRTLLAIVGDKEKKREVVQRIAETTDFSPDKVEAIIATTIRILINETRLN
jgi:hypothetical protein